MNLNRNKNKLSKQLEQEQNHRNGDHMECYQQGGGGGRMGTESEKWRSPGGLSAGRGMGEDGEKVQGIRGINGRNKIDRGRLRIV